MHHLGLDLPVARREHQPTTAPEALDEDEQRRFLRAVQRHPSARDRAVALVLLYAGLRADELAQLYVQDVPISTRRGKVIVRAGKGHDGGTYREVQFHRAARDALRAWLDERANWPGAEATSALWLNRRGGRLSVRNSIVRDLAVAAGLVHDSGPDAGKARVHPHTLRHTFGTQLLRSGVDVVTVADLMGHAKLDSTRIYTRSSAADRGRVRVEPGGDGRAQIRVGGLEKLEEAPSLLVLRELTEQMMPQVDLPELLLEVHARTGYLSEVTHASDGEARMETDGHTVLTVAEPIEFRVVFRSECAVHTDLTQWAIGKAHPVRVTCSGRLA